MESCTGQEKTIHSDLPQKKFNRLISQKRFKIEQEFGPLKRRFRFFRASYMTRIKVEAQLRLKSICFNLLKAVNMVRFA